MRAPLSHTILSRMTSAPRKKKRSSRKYVRPKTQFSPREKGQQDGSSVLARKGKENIQISKSKWVSKPEPRHRYRVSAAANRQFP